MRNAKRVFLTILLSIASIGQIILSYLLYRDEANTIIRNLGWIILWMSAIFGLLPIYTLKKWGKVPKRKSYMHTTSLVNRGVYAIVRHPQYLAGILIALGLSLIAQHWAVVVLGGIVIVMHYFDTFEEEESMLEKFGYEYSEYMQKVPRLNFLIGIIRLLIERYKPGDTPTA